MLSGAHREIKTLANCVAIYWRYGRGAGSVPLASFKAATLAEALELESNGALELAEAWTAIHRPMPSIAYLSGMLAGFQASKKFARMAVSTQAEWSRCISQINSDIGTMTRRQLESPAATRELTTWRDGYELTPRKADYLVTVLKAALKHARTMGWLSGDPCAGIEALYYCDRSEIVWHAGEIEALCDAMQPDMARVIRFMWLTGLRRGDAVTVRWDSITDGTLIVRTSKSKGRAKQVIEIGDHLQQLLADTPRRAITIMSGPTGAPYSPDSITQGLIRALRRIRAKPGLADFAKGKRLHDLRGSHATDMVATMLADPALREKMGWTTGKTSAPSRYVAPVTALATARKMVIKNET
jgi:integrase